RAEMLLSLRRLMREPDPAEVRKAADILARFLASDERNRTRVEVEELRAETKLAVAEAKATAQARKDAAAEAARARSGADLGMSAEQWAEWERRDAEIDQRHARRHAEEVARTKSVVYLWGGCHKLGSTPPDDTDTPLVVISDQTISGRQLYWALTDP